MTIASGVEKIAVSGAIWYGLSGTYSGVVTQLNHEQIPNHHVAGLTYNSTTNTYFLIYHR